MPAADAGAQTMIVVFWDIDGTLLTTGRGGVLALEDACVEVTGRALNLQSIKSDGLTDHQLAVKILEQAGAEPARERVGQFLRAYERQLPRRLPERRGHVLQNVREILTHMTLHRPHVHSLLLTGNTAAGARAKLTHYELQEFFDGGAFSDDTGPRAQIAVRALAHVTSVLGAEAVDVDRVFVVGDTIHDIDCARAIGAQSIAVATGVYDREALAAHGAWKTVDHLPAPHLFDELIGAAGGASSA